LVLPGTTFDSLEQVYSHPQALAQCERFLRSLTGVEIVASYDTAGSAKMIAEQRLAGVGAIASERAGAIFGLDTLRAGVQDQDDNTTRFLIVTRAAAVPDFLAGRAANKTTIVFTLPNTPGALFKALSVFALRDIDVTKIESRPTGRPWEYLFHMDLAVGQHELPCARALSHLAEFAPSLKVLGSYPGVARSADTAVAQGAPVAGGIS
jgi:prephenate dehydratase